MIARVDRLVERARRFWEDLMTTNEALLARDLRAWASSIGGALLIATAPLRRRVRLAGLVHKITLRTDAPFDHVESVLFDGSQHLRVIWLGRGRLPRFDLGCAMIVEGVVGESDGVRWMFNPAFEFATRQAP